MAIVNLREERRCGDGFLTEYLKYTEHQESPEDFHTWVGLSCVASAMGRRCWINRGSYNIYPNIYTVLAAESATLHKSTCLKLGVRLLKEALPEDLNFFAQKITTEAFIKFLNSTYEKQKISEGIIHASEFSVFFGKSATDPTLLQTLTDMYDCPGHWSYSTMTRGVEHCNNICINMMAGSTPDWLKSSLPTESVGGGFFSRLLIIYRQECGRKIPFPEDCYNSSVEIAYRNCINDIQVVRNMGGEYRWEKRAKEMYANWYYSFNDASDAPPYLRGYYGRKGDNIIKLAMICSASKSSVRKITDQDIMFAITLLNENEQYMKGIINLLGQTEEGKRNEKILYIIRKRKSITHSQLLQSLSHQMNKDEIALVVATLIESNLVKKDFDGRKFIYHAIT